MERSSNLKIARCPLSCRADRLFTFSIIAYSATALQDEIKKGEEECGWSRRRKRQPTGSLPTREAAWSSVFTATSPISCDVAIEIKRWLPDCRVYLICEDGYPKKQAAVEKAVELKLIDGYCIGDLDPQQMRAWLDEATESMRAAESRDTEFRREEKQA